MPLFIGQIDFQNLMGGLISVIKLFTESAPLLFEMALEIYTMHDLKRISGFPLNDFCVNYEKMGFLEIGGGSINRLP